MSHFDFALILPVLLACFLGGLLKGATGAGAPVVGVPVLAALTNVQFAVAVFVTSNLLTNVNQAWQYRKAQLPWPFMVLFAGGGAVGSVAATGGARGSASSRSSAPNSPSGTVGTRS